MDPDRTHFFDFTFPLSAPTPYFIFQDAVSRQHRSGRLPRLQQVTQPAEGECRQHLHIHMFDPDGLHDQPAGWANRSRYCVCPSRSGHHILSDVSVWYGDHATRESRSWAGRDRLKMRLPALAVVSETVLFVLMPVAPATISTGFVGAAPAYSRMRKSG